MAVGHEGAALARGAEAEAFEREQNRWRKIVVNHQGGKLVLADAGHGVDLVRGGLHGRAPEVVRWHGGTGKCGSLREAADVDGRLGQVLRAFRRGQDEGDTALIDQARSEEPTSELQSLMHISYAV